MEKKNKKKKRTRILITSGMILTGIAVVGSIYSHFGGFGTGTCADTTEFTQYAEQAASAIGFVIYRTDEMAELISYM